MSIQNDIGKKGEELAIDYLISLDYRIVETNWRFSRAEIDIIAKDGDILVFVEVKTRTNDYFGPPDIFISPKKELMVSEAAAGYMRKINYEWEFRFDIVSVLLIKPGCPAINHFKDAFFPGLK